VTREGKAVEGQGRGGNNMCMSAEIEQHMFGGNV
jgi:hypothetical protein